MITVWTLRLGLFLFYRALRWGDSRFHDVLDKPATLFVFYWLQSVWCWGNCLPAIIVNGTGADPAGLQPQDIIGPVLWALGMVLECTADFQKLFFKMDPANKASVARCNRHGMKLITPMLCVMPTLMERIAGQVR